MDTAPEKDPLIEKAVRLVGRQSDLARLMGCAQQTVSKLLNREIRISAEQAKAIHDATGGDVACWELRPDLWQAPASESEGAAA